MKRLVTSTILFGYIVGCNASSNKAEIQKSKITQNYTIVLDKGVQRVIPLSNNSKNRTTGKDLSKNGIMIAFKDKNLVSISEFEARYGLKYKNKLSIGYYIFDNISSNSDDNIIVSIIKNEKNILTVKPNVRKRNKTR